MWEKKLKSKHGLNIRKHFFTERGVKHWNRCSREVIEAQSLSMSKRHLDNALNHVHSRSAMEWSGSWSR